MSWKIPLADLDFGDEEAAAVLDVLKSRWLTMGAVTQEFEKEAGAYNQVKHAIAVTNCTAALHLACMAIGLKPGDEVIVPALTFVATANAVRYTGATPVFADVVGPTDLNISPESIESRVTSRTRAIIVMHYGGYPCDMPAILEIAKKHNLHVIEDAAHAIGSELDGKKLGGWGELGCYSFFSNKNMTTGEGGMVTTNDDALAAKVNLMRSHGMTTLTWDRHRGHAFGYDVVESGYNYRIDEIRAALGVTQLKKLDKNNARRRELTKLYHQSLQELVPQATIPFVDHRGVSAAHILPVLLPQGINRIQVMEALKSQEIQTSNHYPPAHLFTAFRSQNGDGCHLPLTEDIARREVTLPLYPAMTDENVLTVVYALREALRQP